MKPPAGIYTLKANYGWVSIKASDSQKISKILWNTGLVEVRRVPPEEPFTYTDGSLGPGYINVKELPSYPPEMEAVMDIVKERYDELGLDNEIDAICGIITGGDPFAYSLSVTKRRPFIRFRPDKKKHGHPDQIIGVRNNPYIPAGSRILGFEDVINNASTTENFLETFKNSPYEVTWLFAVVHYGKPPAKEKLNRFKAGIEGFLMLNDLLNYGIMYGKVGAEAADDYLHYLADSEGWNRRYLEMREV